MDYPARKPNRLTCYNYAENGAYFITCCTKDRCCLFSDRENPVQLTPWGKIVEQTICEIPDHYSGVQLVQYVVMPNHVHLLLLLSNSDVSVSQVVQQLKHMASVRFVPPAWQKSFHDRVVRNAHEYKKIMEYIDNNPLRWELDRYYQKTTLAGG